jgi:hypothetical protein
MPPRNHNQRLLALLCAGLAVGAACWWLVDRRGVLITPAKIAAILPPTIESGTASGSPLLVRLGPARTGSMKPTFPHRYAVPARAEEFSKAAGFSMDQSELVRMRVGAQVRLAYFNGRVLDGVVGLIKRDHDGQLRVFGSLTTGGGFYLSNGPKGVGGRIMPAGEETVAVVQRTKNGEAFLVEKPHQAVVCSAYPSRRVTGGTHAPTTGSTGGLRAAESQPVFNSRPDATAVAYLDFDGETVPAGEWSLTPVEALPSGFSDGQIEETWRRVSEDYRAFNINVTTDPARYAAAPVGSRIRCIITQTSDVAPTAGGVGYIGSWADADTPDYSDDVPCWVFTWNVGFDAKGVAEAASHEIGHTLGLSHDGLMNEAETTIVEYYEGRGTSSTGWAPIMGVGYYQPLTQWSHGDYTDGERFANNTEDDLAIIASAANHTRYARDVVPQSSADSTVFTLTGAGAGEVTGVIERSGDMDGYAVTVSAGTLTFSTGQALAETAVLGLSNVDVQLALYDAGGSLVEAANPVGSLFPQLSVVVASGTYYLKVQAVGEGTGVDSGYPTYGSLGRYRVVASFTEASGLPPTLVGAGDVVFVAGVASTYPVQATAAPAGYVVAGLPDGVVINPTTGVISGTAPETGIYPFTVTATNAAGASSRVFNLRVIAGTLAQAVDARELVWTTGGNLPWTVDESDYETGFASARSGAVAEHYGHSWIETTVEGPGQLTFDWKVSSEENTIDPNDPYDRLEFAIDGVRQDLISGEKSWAHRIYDLPEGMHTLRWTYQKDPYSSVGEDAGWLDAVVYARNQAPVVTVPLQMTATMGNGCGFQIVATDAPASYSATGLPPGLTLNTETGLIQGIPTAAGDYEITLGATNTHGTGNATLALTVRSRFTAWAQTHGLTGAQAANAADPDNDGLSNLLEYALGFDPTTPASEGGPVVALDNQSHLEIDFILAPGRGEVTCTVEVTADLTHTWQRGHAYGAGADNSGSLPTEEVARTPLGDGRERIRVREILSAAEPRRFLRLKITSP